MKAIWKGSISFGLINIPIQLFSAVQEHVIGFKLLCAQCHTPIEYQRFCSHCNKKIEWANIVKGLEVSPGKYIVLTQEKIKSLKPESTNTIDIIEFVETSLVQPIYYDQHYYIAPPDEKKAKAYLLLTQALKIMNKAAIGKFVMRDKEHMCALQAYENGLLLSTLNYTYEIRAMDKVLPLAKNKQIAISQSELKLAKELINKLSNKKFDISKFKDTFAEQIMKLIKQHKKGKVISEPKKKTKAVSKRAASLEDVLRESLHEARA